MKNEKIQKNTRSDVKIQSIVCIVCIESIESIGSVTNFKVISL